MPWTAGQCLQGGKYVIGEVLGQGGFGITYKALHIELNQTVVIKTPNEYLRHDPEYDKYIEPFIKEGRTLARLSQDSHPHIVGVIELFKEGAIHCLVMEFVEGENLFEAVRRRGALTEAEILPCICQIGEALSVVHQAGLVHRDAHPGNIMLQRNGRAVLIDFGIAKQVVPSTISSTNKHGHEAFAPYEQKVRGSREPTVDVYCLAATLYYAVTGQRPTTSLARKLDNASLKSPKQINPSISDQLNQAILKGMALEANDRPQSMQAWLTMLKAPKAVPPPLVDIKLQSKVSPVIASETKWNEAISPKALLQQNVTWYEPVHKTEVVRRQFDESKSKPATKSPRIIPWVRLVGILFIYIFIGYCLAFFLSKAPLFWVVCTWAFVWAFVWWAVAVAVTLTWAAWVWAVAVAGTLFWARTLFWVVVWAWFVASIARKLQESFSKIHTFLILAGTSNLGLSLGWLGHRIFHTGS
ncbi:serine/threonine protein kinase [Brasilonema octagenarum UFV-E1]|uniref:Serine/threonine protein kinase n=1 Tax=Brasilonema sennae CENA114 TaxID=415709 RepID=A0A856MBK4_9CYAN|nr:serine/threonine-protein kinase [Brasilonema sennae]QDL08072.1 serine/threonine protein kinase [Brasilonema sennae CENA114]QDL14431.1 serine/threonine protein kinase [Brasilonema octagenarum UFV-E1]